jgi:hypothetical protein
MALVVGAYESGDEGAASFWLARAAAAGQPLTAAIEYTLCAPVTADWQNLGAALSVRGLARRGG